MEGVGLITYRNIVYALGKWWKVSCDILWFYIFLGGYDGNNGNNDVYVMNDNNKFTKHSNIEKNGWNYGLSVIQVDCTTCDSICTTAGTVPTPGSGSQPKKLLLYQNALICWFF